MMLRNLVDEVVRRGLWPIPLVALAVVVAAPLLFLKSAPPQAATDATVAAAAVDADLPARAQRLLTTTDAGQSSGRRLSRSARDPFQAPASRSAAAKKVSKAKSSSSSSSSAKTETAAKGTRSDPVPVIILTPKGKKTKDSTTTAGTGTSTSRSTTSTSDSTQKSLPTVDVRFGAHKDSPIQRSIARLKTFEVGGDVAAIFVKYSPSRHKAVFAIGPTTTVRGDNRCRREGGVCSYVDIPAGSYARLTFTRPDGSRVSRRLDVVRVHGDA